MFGLDDAILYGKAGISMIPGIVDVVKKIRKTDTDPSIQKVLDQLIADTREACKSLREETNSIERSLRDLDVDPTKTLREISENLKWYNWVAKNKLAKHKKTLKQIEENLSSSVDDFVAVLVCAGKVPSFADANDISDAVKRDLDGLSQKPIEDLLKDFRTIIDRYTNELR